MSKSMPLLAAAALAILAGCGSGTDRPAPTGPEIEAQNKQRQQSIDNNSAIPAEARERIKSTISSGKR